MLHLYSFLCSHAFLPSSLYVSSALPSQILHARYVLEVLFETKKNLKQMPNFTHVKSSPAKDITICGKFQSRVAKLIFWRLLVPRHLPNLKTA